MTAHVATTAPALEIMEAVMARALARGVDALAIVREARRIAREARQRALPEFVARQLGSLDALARLVESPAVEEAARKRALGALAYVTEADDLVPDATPEIGLVDDAIVIERVAFELQPQLEALGARCQAARAERRAMFGRMERRREQRARRGGLFALR